MKKVTSLIIIITGIFAVSATAQSISNTIGFGPKIGYYKATDADEGNIYGGIQARIRLGSHFGIEGSLEYRAGQEYGIADYTVRTSFVPATASFMLFAPVSDHFTPYGLLGAGVYYTNYRYSQSAEAFGFTDDNSFNVGYHLGFGTELPFSEHVALSLDYRYLFLNPNRNEQSFEGADFNGNVFTAGLMFYF